MLDNQVLCEIGSKYHKSSAQIALRWELQQDIIPITKSMNPGRMAQNSHYYYAEFGIVLTKDVSLQVSNTLIS